METEEELEERTVVRSANKNMSKISTTVKKDPVISDTTLEYTANGTLLASKIQKDFQHLFNSNS